MIIYRWMSEWWALQISHFLWTRTSRKPDLLPKLLLLKIANNYAKDSIQNAFRHTMKRRVTRKYLPRSPRTIVATTLVKCRWKQFPYSLRFNTVERSFSLFACRIVNEYSSFQVVCKQSSLEFVRHFELSRETADHNFIPETVNLWVPRAQWRDFDMSAYKNFTMIILMHHLV